MTRPKLLFLIIPFFLIVVPLTSTGCAKVKNSKSPLIGLFEVKPPDPNTVTVGVLPVQNATFRPIRLTGKRYAIDRFLQGFLERSLKFKYNEDDIAYVQKTLQLITTQRLYNAHFQVLSPDRIYAIFAQTGIRDMDGDLNIEELTTLIPADWLLLVTLTEWEGEKFEKTGKGKFSYQAVLVDTRLKKAVWQKSRDHIYFKAPRPNLPYNRQGGEMLNEIAKIILKDFPKLEKIGDYQSKQTVSST